MTAYIVDANVPIDANGDNSDASIDCNLACISRLRRIVERGIVAIDTLGDILQEYRRYLHPSGQPGVGDAFFRHVFQNQANPERCERVEIRRRKEDPGDFQEFPTSADLARFDRSDRKFVAVALASALNPRVQNATDSDWWQYRRALEKHGVRIDFLCPDMIKRDA